MNEPLKGKLFDLDGNRFYLHNDDGQFVKTESVASAVAHFLDHFRNLESHTEITFNDLEKQAKESFQDVMP